MADTKKDAPKAAPKKEAPKPGKPAAKAGAPKAAPAAKPGAQARARPGAPTPGIQRHNPYDVVFHPVVTEKTMFNMDNNNTLEFLVHIDRSKPEIKAAIEELFTVKVDRVRTRIAKDGKRAVVTFAEGVSAEDIGTRIGVF